MPYRQSLQESLDYLEENLQCEVTAQELADRAGVSLFYYYRLFRRYTGMPVMQYILRRRLMHAAYAVRSGEKRIDAALAYGFETYAGFYKAFRREFGCTPSQYIRLKRAKRPVRQELLAADDMELTRDTARNVLKHWNRENEPVADLYYESSGYRAPQAKCVGESCVLKRERERQTIQNAIQIARELENAGVHTYTPVPASDGRLTIEKDGWWYWLAERPKTAQIRAESMYGPDSAAKARFAGEVIGQLHLILRKAETAVEDADLLQAVRGWALPAIRDKLKLSDGFINGWLERFESLYPRLPRQVIHRDPNPGAILSSEQGWGMIDLERAERNARLFDPCYAATAILSESFDEKNEAKLNEWTGIYHNLLEGYDSVAALTPQEKECAPFMVLANQFVCTAWFAGQKQYPELYETNLKMTKWILAHAEELALV